MRKDYKDTEVGVIPSDWKVKKIYDVSEVKTGPFGSTLHERDYVEDGTPIITVEHLGEQGVVHINLPMVSDADRKRLQGYSLQTGDLVFSRVGSVDRNSLISEKENEWLFSGRLLRIRVKNKAILPVYLSYCFHQESTKQRIRSVAVGQTMASLNTQILNDVQVAFPPTLAEQERIAKALSDTDALITSLEKLITKKRNIKQGTMQELLTGKKRLPGFNGKWEVKKLGEIGEIVTGSTPPTQTKEYWNGSIPWITPTDISDEKNIFNSEREISPLGLQVIRKLPANTLLVTCIASIGKNAILRVDGASNQQINAIIPYKDYDLDFLYYLIENNKQYLLGNAGITATLMISKKDFSEIIFLFPPQKNEQSSIANILSDMDAEIKQLEQKLSKYKFIKQGMMQELLTGKIRLV
jgi:type I restriction enzyme S subunit